MSLDEEKIDTEDDVAIMFQYMGRQRDGGTGRDLRGSSTPGGFDFECGNVRSVDGKCTLGVEGGDGAVAERPAAE